MSASPSQVMKRSADWRGTKPAWQPPRDIPTRPWHRAWLRVLIAARRFARGVRACLMFEETLLGPACNKRDIAIWLVGCAWGVMFAIGIMAAWGIHP